MNDSTVSFFTYGFLTCLDILGDKKTYLMRLCPTNYSFLEVIDPSDFIITKWLSIFHIRNTRIIFNKSLKIRTRNYHDSFDIICKNAQTAKYISHKFHNLIEYAKGILYAEYSLKNIIRTCLYSIGIANVDNKYTSSDISLLFKKLAIFLDISEYDKIILNCVKNPNSITNLDLKQIFDVLFIKEELVSVFKSLMKISDDQKIGLLKMPIDVLEKYFLESQSSNTNNQILRKYLREIEISNILLPFEQEINEVSFQQFCMFHFSVLNRADDMHRLSLKEASDLRLNQCFISACVDPALKLYNLDEMTSLEGVERAIEAGCRYINLSISNGNDGKPILTTLATNKHPIPVEVCFELISEIAFENSDMPFIIALEVFCNKSQRDALAEILNKVFTGRLFCVPTSSFHSSSMPPIKLLKKRILIKYKAKYPYYISEEHGDFRGDSREILDTLTALYEEPFLELRLKTVYGILSISSSKLESILADDESKERLMELTRMNLVCLDKNELTTTNFAIKEALKSGIQIWMLNLQINDEISFFHKTLFRRNKNSGIIPKPASMSINNEYNDSNIIKFVFKIISSQIINISENDFPQIVYPFITAKVIGNENDVGMNKIYRTSIFQNNLLHSIYDESKVEFSFSDTETSFILFEVIDIKTKKIIKRALLSPEYIKPGLKSVLLYDTNNNFDGFSFLLVYIETNSFRF